MRRQLTAPNSCGAISFSSGRITLCSMPSLRKPEPPQRVRLHRNSSAVQDPPHSHVRGAGQACRMDLCSPGSCFCKSYRQRRSLAPAGHFRSSAQGRSTGRATSAAVHLRVIFKHVPCHTAAVTPLGAFLEDSEFALRYRRAVSSRAVGTSRLRDTPLRALAEMK